MALKLDDKKQVVHEVAAVAKQATSMVAAEYNGLTVAKFTQLRRLARQENVHLRVVRNTLAHRALVETEFACLCPLLSGSLVLLFSTESPGAAPRVIRSFIKEHDEVKVKALAMHNQLFLADRLDQLANLPTRHEALAQLMATMLAPITKLVRTLIAPHDKFVKTLAAVAKR